MADDVKTKLYKDIIRILYEFYFCIITVLNVKNVERNLKRKIIWWNTNLIFIYEGRQQRKLLLKHLF